MASKKKEENPENDASVTVRPVSALVPEQVSRGVFSTGVIVVTGNTEFVLDFVLVIGAPSTVVARVICTHEALRRMVAAIHRNVASFAARGDSVKREESADATPTAGGTECHAEDGNFRDSIGTEQFVGVAIPVPDGPTERISSADKFVAEGDSEAPVAKANKQSPAELYDDISVPDDVQVGVYANGLIIGHTDSEFKLDFVANMFPKSVVTSRVFMSGPQLVRLLDTLERTLQQFDLRHKS